MQPTRKVTYEELKQAGLPKSRGQMLDDMVHGAFQNFVKGMPKNLIVPIILIGGIFLLNFFFVVFSRMVWEHDGDSFLSNVANYLFASSLGYDRFKGFSALQRKTTRMIVNLDFVTIMGITSFITRFRKVKAKAFGDAFRAFSVRSAAAKFSNHTGVSYVFRGFFIAFLIAFILKNPFAIVFAAVFLMAEAGRAKESQLFQTIFQWRLLSPKKKTVTDADVVLDIFWVALGMVLYIPVILLTWTLFRYGFFARVILTFLFAGFFLLMALLSKTKTDKTVAAILFFLCTTIALFYLLKVDVSASKLSLRDELFPHMKRNSGTVLKQFGEEAKDNAGPSFFRSAWAAISAAASQVWSQVAGFFSKGTYPAIKAAADMASTDNSFDMGLQAYESAMSSIPGFGDTISNAAEGIDAGMNGK